MNNKLKIIDLLNKIANGEEVPKKIRIDHWWYEFEWVEHLDNYYDNSADIDLMSALSMSKEELNYELRIKLEDEVELIEEEKKIELPEELKEILIPSSLSDSDDFRFIFNYINDLIKNQKQIIDYLKANGERNHE